MKITNTLRRTLGDNNILVKCGSSLVNEIFCLNLLQNQIDLMFFLISPDI